MKHNLKSYVSLMLAMLLLVCNIPMQAYATENTNLPNATVEAVQPNPLLAGNYKVWNGSLSEGKTDLPLQVALNFKANDTLEEALAGGYADWLCDFYLTFDGMETNKVSGVGSYLAGYYGDFGWIAIPTDTVTVERGVEYPIVSQYDATLNYKDICKSVKDFTAALYINPETLAANPNMSVTLKLKMTNPDGNTESVIIGDPFVYTAAELSGKKWPDATVESVQPNKLIAGSYSVWDGSLKESTIDRPLQVALNFKANDTLEEAIAGGYSEWLCDFYLTFDGMETETVSGVGSYLAGYYGSFGWIAIPTDTVTVKRGVEYPIVSQYDATLNYKDICSSVKDFTAALYISPETLLANPNMSVTLKLKMTNPDNKNDSVIIGTPYIYTANDLLAANGYAARNTTTKKLYSDVNLANLEAADGETVILLADVKDVKILSVLETLDLNGHTLEAEYVTSFGHIVDNNDANAGMLKVPTNKFLLQSDNAQLPVHTAEGYQFVEVRGFNKAYLDTKQYVFQPLFEDYAHGLLLAGAETSGVNIQVNVSWKTQEGALRSQNFIYNDSFVKDYIRSYKPATKKYGQMFTLKLGETPMDLTYQAQVAFENKVSIKSDSTFVESTGGSTGGSTEEDTKDNTTTEKITINTNAGDNQASAVVSQGTKLEGSATADSLKLTVSELADSQGNITLGENEVQKSVDVHIEGISKDNTVPMLITVAEFAEKGLNEGNLKLYHVEKGETAQMTQVFALTEVDAHNEFYYDPATGDITMALATFSEIALVADTTAAWGGNFDYSWYINAVAPIDGESTTEYAIANADQLAAFGAIVGGMNGQTQNSFAGKTVKLLADVNLGDKESENNPNIIFYPIGYYNSEGTYERTNTAITSGLRNFEGIFDGNGHTIENFYHNTWEMKGDHDWYSPEEQYYRDGMGLFGKIYKGTVKNLTVKNFSSDGEIATTGVIAAYADGATFENIAITNCNPRVYNIGNGGIVGCVGWYAKDANLKTTFTNITVDNSNKISALWGSYDVACGGLVGQYYPTSGQTSAGTPKNAGIDFVNCHVSAQMDVYNDVCANYQYYAYRYTGMLIGSVRENVTDEATGHVYPKMDGITASGCTVHFGTWNDYYYCELVANSQASYTHDHQFSRLEQVQKIEDKSITYLNGETGTVPSSGSYNYVVVNGSHATENATCYHFVNGEVWTHDKAGTEIVNGATVLKEDKQHIYLEFNNLVTGYGWGVTSKGLTDYEGVTNMDITHGDYEESVVKFEGKVSEITTNTEYKLSDLFNFVDNGVDVIPSTLMVAVTDLNKPDNVVNYTFARDAENWGNGTLTVTNTGSISITIQDYYFCKPTTITVNITERQSAEKFETKFTGDFLYRVGNKNAVKLDSLFTAKDGAEIGTVSVDVEAVDGTGASGTYTSNATWTNGTIQFSGTGVVKVTITDNDYCKATELYLEIVDAVNATGATSATANNVVLLNDCGLSSLTVSGRYTFYGNGFTATYTGNGQYLNNGLKQGVVTVSENGTLDNLRIKASIYPVAYMYYGTGTDNEYVQAGPSSTEGTGENKKTRYHYQLSAVTAKDNATISNCYIYGGRNNIFVDTGDVTIKDSVLECGTVANIQIQSNASHAITLKNVTTIQHRVNATIGDTSKVMLGAGVIVGPETTENPKIVLNGDFKQYNWVTAEDKNAVSGETTKTIIESALSATDFNHTVNGKTASNLGIIYMNTANAEVENNTGLPYEAREVSISLAKGKVFSLKNAGSAPIYSDYANADRSTVNDLYKPQFKYSANLGGQYIEKTDDGDEHLYREGDTIYCMFPSGDSKEIDLAKLVDIAKYSGQDLGLVISCKDENGNAVAVTDGKIKVSDAGEYIITYTVTDSLFYDKDGKKIESANSINYPWDVTLSVSLKDTAIPDARFEFDATKQKMGYYKPSWGDVKQYLPFLAGLKIYDYNGQTEYLRFDGSSDFNKVASITITGYASNKASVEIKLTDGGVINTQFLARANSGGGSTYTGKIKTSNNTIYFVTDSGTSNKDTTTTAAYWYVDYYKFTGNNGVAIQSGQQTFNSTGSSASTPSGNFSTTIKYTVTYDANEGNCGQTTGYATSASAAVTLPTPTRSGYIFAGWYTAAGGGTRVGGAGEFYTPSANITLYAQWGKPCTVTYNANGGSCDTASEKYTGTALTLPTPTRDGYWFTGWYDAATGGNKIGDAGATYNPSGDVTLYAHWQEKVEYTVTYNANGGSCGTASATYQGTALTLPIPTRTGYTFNGWYTAASGGTKIGDAGAKYTPSANITLYAQWQISSYTITVTTSNATVKVNGTTVSNNGTVSIQYGTQVTVEVTYSESNDRSTTIKGTDGTTYTSPFTMPAQNVTINATSSPSSCITPDTLITLADGSRKMVKDLNGTEELLVWNLETGAYDKANIVFVDSDAESDYEIVHLYFADGSDVEVIYEHGFFDYDLGKYVYLDASNAKDYIGHKFVKQADIASNTWETAKLTNVVIENKRTMAYSPVTFEHLCYYTNGMLSMPGGIEGLFNIFEVDTKTMSYDPYKMAQDIKKYGLFTYADFAGIIPEIAYEAFNGDILKVAIGKQLIRWEDIEQLAERYVPLIPTEEE